ncbi:MAG: segregation/condensation protein A [Patescibacteria group bacterium]
MTEFRSEKFSGPLELLWSLIEKEEMDITEIALAKIADEYIAYLKNSDYIDPEQVADFLVIAAKLLYAKSKALLPYLSTPAEDEEIEELEHQLRMYKEFLEASKGLEKMLAKKKFSFGRDLGKSGKRRQLFLWQKFSPPKNLTAEMLREHFDYILGFLTAEETELKEEIIEYKISIEEKINFIQRKLIDKISFSFSQVIEQAGNRTEIIVSFLAVLELAKQQELVFEQDGLFSEIIINKLN